MKFIAKNCAAWELHMETSSSVETLGDLRAAICDGWGLPPFMQQIMISGASHSDRPDRELLATLFARHPVEPDRDCLAWVPWLAEDDHIDMGMGWTFHKDVLDRIPSVGVPTREQMFEEHGQRNTFGLRFVCNQKE